jgi:hypothetical protein
MKYFQIGKLYTLNLPGTRHLGAALFAFRDPQKDHMGNLTGEDIAKNDVFVLLEYCNFPYSVQQHRLHVLTKNGTTGWLTLSNVLTDYMVPASM